MKDYNSNSKKIAEKAINLNAPAKKYSKPAPRPVQFTSEQKSLRKHVQSKFDLSKLRRVCGLDERDFAKSYPDLVMHSVPGSSWGGKPVPDSFYYFANRGASVLAVAHLDAVQSARFCAIDRGTVYSPVLDDRLGAYTILELLPALGITVDVLLTTDEEIGASTASSFKPADHGIDPSRYNFIIEFDRAGTDCVMYQFGDNDDFNDAIEKHEWEIGWGSYSDISMLGNVGCCAVNFGVGYIDYHSIGSHVPLKDYFANIVRFFTFYNEFKDTRFDYIDFGPMGGGNYGDGGFDYGWAGGGYSYRDKYSDDDLAWLDKNGYSYNGKTHEIDLAKDFESPLVKADAAYEVSLLELMKNIPDTAEVYGLMDEIDMVFGVGADDLIYDWFYRENDHLTPDGYEPSDELNRKQIRLLWERDHWTNPANSEIVGALSRGDWAYIAWQKVEQIMKDAQADKRADLAIKKAIENGLELTDEVDEPARLIAAIDEAKEGSDGI